MKKILSSLLLPALLAGGLADAHRKPPPPDLDRDVDPCEGAVAYRRPPPPPPKKLTPAQLAVLATNAFSADLYRELAARDGNLVFSPASIEIALGMTIPGAAGDTLSEMSQVMHGTDFAPLVAAIAGAGKQKGVELRVADRIWADKQFPFLASYLQTTSKTYGAPVETVDFRKKAESIRKTINKWVAGQTKDHIKKLLPEGSLTDLTRMVLVNAIYFKASWQHGFKKADTADGDFTKADGTKTTAKLMTQAKNEFPMAVLPGNGLSIIELPYKGSSLAMDVILPDDAAGLPAVEAQLSQGMLDSWLTSMQPTNDVLLTLPRFTMTMETPVTDALKQLGMVHAFDQDSADFSAMIDAKKATQDQALYISAIFHQAFIAVDEQGSEAAAATGVVMAEPTAVHVQPTFRADHPFVYLIRDTKTGAILFMGRVADPTAI